MFKTLTGRSSQSSVTSKTQSSSKRRKGEQSPSASRTSRRRADSPPTTNTSRKTSRRYADDSRNDFHGSRPSDFPPSRSQYSDGAAPVVASSHATTPTHDSIDAQYRTAEPVRNGVARENMPRSVDPPSRGESDRGSKSERRRERNDSHERGQAGGRRDSRREDRSKRKESTRGQEDLGASQTSFPTSYHGFDPRPDHQFAAEFPTSYALAYRPPGLAAEYYGDFGESVSTQPGVRPEAPSIVMNSEQAHLQEASQEVRPPIEPSSVGQLGASASFYTDMGHAESMAQSPIAPTPPRKESVHSGRQSGAAASPKTSPGPEGRPLRPSDGVGSSVVGSAAVGGAIGAGLAAGYHSNRPIPVSSAPSQQHGSSSFTVDYSNPSYNHSSSRPPRPSQKPSSASHLPLGAAAGAGVCYANQHQHSAQPSSSFDAQANPLEYSTAQAPLRHRHRHRHLGPIDKLINFFKDPDAVAEYEDYTIALGVCRYCFDPATQVPGHGPRKHHYPPSSRRGSNSRYGSSTRIDKSKRYPSSDEEKRKRSARRKIVAGGLAGYGLSKMNEAITNKNKDFDDSYSVKTGRPVNESRVSFATEDRNYPAEERYSSREDLPSSPKGSRRNRDTKLHRDATMGKLYEGRSTPRAKRRESGPASGTWEDRSRGSAISIGMPGASIVGASSDHGRQSTWPESRYYAKRVSPQHSYVELGTTEKASQGFASFFTSPSANKRRGKKPKGLFNFGNVSSSSSDADLAFGVGSVRRKKGRREMRSRTSDSNDTAAILGLVTAGVALAAAKDKEHRRKGKQRADFNSRHSSPTRRTVTKHHSSSPSESENDGWESASDDDTSSADSGLLYGISRPLSSRQSRESLTSNEGTSKWSWRWNNGSKKRKRPAPAPLQSRPHFDSTPGLLAEAVAAIGMSSESQKFPTDRTPSLPSMQLLDPVPMSDLTKGQSSKIMSPRDSMYPAVFAQADIIPLQQPQPFTPVSQSIYTTQAAPSQSTYRPSDPAVYSHTQAPIVDSPKTVTRQGSRSDKDTTPRRRRDTPPAVLPSHAHRAREEPAQPSNNQVSQSKGRKFDPEEEQAGLDRYSQEREQRRLQRLERAERKEREERAERENRAERKHERHRRRSSADVTKAQNESVPQSLVKETSLYTIPDDGLRAREKEIDQELKGLYEVNRISSNEQRRAGEATESWTGPMGSVGIVGAGIAAATVTTMPDARPERAEKRPRRRSSSKEASVSPSRPIWGHHPKYSNESEDEDSQQRRIARMVAQRTRRETASPVHEHESYASYFVPPELAKHVEEHNYASSHRDRYQSNSTADPLPSNPDHSAPQIVEIMPGNSRRRGRTNEFDPFLYKQFGLEDDHDPLRYPWRVPLLDLIEPTPPHSERGDYTPKSPESPSPNKVVEHEHQADPADLEHSTADFVSEPTATDIVPRHTEYDEAEDADVAVGPELKEIQLPQASSESKPAFGEQAADGYDPKIPQDGQEDFMVTRQTVASSPDSPSVVGFPTDEERQINSSVPTPPRVSSLPQTSSSRENDSIPASPNRPSPVPQRFPPDFEFAAMLAAGAASAGFDPEPILSDPSYHERDSPPESDVDPDGSLGLPLVESVSDYSPLPGQQGFVEDEELPPTPEEEKENEIKDTDTAEPTELSKRDKRKPEKLSGREGVSASPSPEIEIPALPVERSTPRELEQSLDLDSGHRMPGGYDVFDDSESVTPADYKMEKRADSLTGGRVVQPTPAYSVPLTAEETEDLLKEKAQHSSQAYTPYGEPIATNKLTEEPDSYPINEQKTKNSYHGSGDTPNDDTSAEAADLEDSKQSHRKPRPENQAFDEDISVKSTPTNGKKSKKSSKRDSKKFNVPASAISDPMIFRDNKQLMQKSKAKSSSGGLFRLFSSNKSDDSTSSGHNRTGSFGAAEGRIPDDIRERRGSKRKSTKAADIDQKNTSVSSNPDHGSVEYDSEEQYMSPKENLQDKQTAKTFLVSPPEMPTVLDGVSGSLTTERPSQHDGLVGCDPSNVPLPSSPGIDDQSVPQRCALVAPHIEAAEDPSSVLAVSRTTTEESRVPEPLATDPNTARSEAPRFEIPHHAVAELAKVAAEVSMKFVTCTAQTEQADQMQDEHGGSVHEINNLSTPVSAEEDACATVDGAEIAPVPLEGPHSSSPAARDPKRQRRLSVIRTDTASSPSGHAQSPTAVPLHFRRLPISPSASRSQSVGSSAMAQISPLVPLVMSVPRTRQVRPHSMEFRSGKDFRPLYLVERHSSMKQPQDEKEEIYPSLPSSRTSSANPSMENLRGEDQDDVFASAASERFDGSSGRPENFASYWYDESQPKSPIDDFLDSRAATPTAAEFSRGVKGKSEKRKYEFHSPSELLEDPSSQRQLVCRDEDPLNSPDILPSVACGDHFVNEDVHMTGQVESPLQKPTREATEDGSLLQCASSALATVAGLGAASESVRDLGEPSARADDRDQKQARTADESPQLPAASGPASDSINRHIDTSVATNASTEAPDTAVLKSDKSSTHQHEALDTGREVLRETVAQSRSARESKKDRKKSHEYRDLAAMHAVSDNHPATSEVEARPLMALSEEEDANTPLHEVTMDGAPHYAEIEEPNVEPSVEAGARPKPSAADNEKRNLLDNLKTSHDGDIPIATTEVEPQAPLYFVAEAVGELSIAEGPLAQPPGLETWPPLAKKSKKDKRIQKKAKGKQVALSQESARVATSVPPAGGFSHFSSLRELERKPGGEEKSLAPGASTKVKGSALENDAALETFLGQATTGRGEELASELLETVRLPGSPETSSTSYNALTDTTAIIPQSLLSEKRHEVLARGAEECSEAPNDISQTGRSPSPMTEMARNEVGDSTALPGVNTRAEAENPHQIAETIHDTPQHRTTALGHFVTDLPHRRGKAESIATIPTSTILTTPYDLDPVRTGAFPPRPLKQELENINLLRPAHGSPTQPPQNLVLLEETQQPPALGVNDGADAQNLSNPAVRVNEQAVPNAEASVSLAEVVHLSTPTDEGTSRSVAGDSVLSRHIDMPKSWVSTPSRSYPSQEIMTIPGRHEPTELGKQPSAFEEAFERARLARGVTDGTSQIEAFLAFQTQSETSARVICGSLEPIGETSKVELEVEAQTPSTTIDQSNATEEKVVEQSRPQSSSLVDGFPTSADVIGALPRTLDWETPSGDSPSAVSKIEMPELEVADQSISQHLDEQRPPREYRNAGLPDAVVAGLESEETIEHIQKNHATAPRADQITAPPAEAGELVPRDDTAHPSGEIVEAAPSGTVDIAPSEKMEDVPKEIVAAVPTIVQPIRKENSARIAEKTVEAMPASAVEPEEQWARRTKSKSMKDKKRQEKAEKIISGFDNTENPVEPQSGEQKSLLTDSELGKVSSVPVENAPTTESIARATELLITAEAGPSSGESVQAPSAFGNDIMADEKEIESTSEPTDLVTPVVVDTESSRNASIVDNVANEVQQPAAVDALEDFTAATSQNIVPQAMESSFGRTFDDANTAKELHDLSTNLDQSNMPVEISAADLVPIEAAEEFPRTPMFKEGKKNNKKVSSLASTLVTETPTPKTEKSSSLAHTISKMPEAQAENSTWTRSSKKGKKNKKRNQTDDWSVGDDTSRSEVIVGIPTETTGEVIQKIEEDMENVNFKDTGGIATAQVVSAKEGMASAEVEGTNDVKHQEIMGHDITDTVLSVWHPVSVHAHAHDEDVKHNEHGRESEREAEPIVSGGTESDAPGVPEAYPVASLTAAFSAEAAAPHIKTTEMNREEPALEALLATDAPMGEITDMVSHVESKGRSSSDVIPSIPEASAQKVDEQPAEVSVVSTKKSKNKKKKRNRKPLPLLDDVSSPASPPDELSETLPDTDTGPVARSFTPDLMPVNTDETSQDLKTPVAEDPHTMLKEESVDAQIEASLEPAIAESNRELAVKPVDIAAVRQISDVKVDAVLEASLGPAIGQSIRGPIVWPLGTAAARETSTWDADAPLEASLEPATARSNIKLAIQPVEASLDQRSSPGENGALVEASLKLAIAQSNANISDSLVEAALVRETPNVDISTSTDVPKDPIDADREVVLEPPEAVPLPESPSNDLDAILEHPLELDVVNPLKQRSPEPTEPVESKDARIQNDDDELEATLEPAIAESMKELAVEPVKAAAAEGRRTGERDPLGNRSHDVLVQDAEREPVSFQKHEAQNVPFKTPSESQSFENIESQRMASPQERFPDDFEQEKVETVSTPPETAAETAVEQADDSIPNMSGSGIRTDKEGSLAMTAVNIPAGLSEASLIRASTDAPSKRTSGDSINPNLVMRDDGFPEASTNGSNKYEKKEHHLALADEVSAPAGEDLEVDPAGPILEKLRRVQDNPQRPQPESAEECSTLGKNSKKTKKKKQSLAEFDERAPPHEDVPQSWIGSTQPELNIEEPDEGLEKASRDEPSVAPQKESNSVEPFHSAEVVQTSVLAASIAIPATKTAQASIAADKTHDEGIEKTIRDEQVGPEFEQRVIEPVDKAKTSQTTDREPNIEVADFNVRGAPGEFSRAPVLKKSKKEKKKRGSTMEEIEAATPIIVGEDLAGVQPPQLAGEEQWTSSSKKGKKDKKKKEQSTSQTHESFPNPVEIQSERDLEYLRLQASDSQTRDFEDGKVNASKLTQSMPQAESGLTTTDRQGAANEAESWTFTAKPNKKSKKKKRQSGFDDIDETTSASATPMVETPSEEYVLKEVEDIPAVAVESRPSRDDEYESWTSGKKKSRKGEKKKKNALSTADDYDASSERPTGTSTPFQGLEAVDSDRVGNPTVFSIVEEDKGASFDAAQSTMEETLQPLAERPHEATIVQNILVSNLDAPKPEAELAVSDSSTIELARSVPTPITAGGGDSWGRNQKSKKSKQERKTGSGAALELSESSNMNTPPPQSIDENLSSTVLSDFDGTTSRAPIQANLQQVHEEPSIGIQNTGPAMLGEVPGPEKINLGGHRAMQESFALGTAPPDPLENESSSSGVSVLLPTEGEEAVICMPLSTFSRKKRDKKKRQHFPLEEEEPIIAKELPSSQRTAVEDKDDVVDTALAVAAGLGFATAMGKLASPRGSIDELRAAHGSTSNEHYSVSLEHEHLHEEGSAGALAKQKLPVVSEDAFEDPAEHTSPTKEGQDIGHQEQPHWSFAKLRAPLEIVQKHINRDSAVQFCDSPAVLVGDFHGSARDSGYISSPNVPTNWDVPPRTAEVLPGISERPGRAFSSTSSSEDLRGRARIHSTSSGRRAALQDVDVVDTAPQALGSQNPHEAIETMTARNVGLGSPTMAVQPFVANEEPAVPPKRPTSTEESTNEDRSSKLFLLLPKDHTENYGTTSTPETNDLQGSTPKPRRSWGSPQHSHDETEEANPDRRPHRDHPTEIQEDIMEHMQESPRGRRPHSILGHYRLHTAHDAALSPPQSPLQIIHEYQPDASSSNTRQRALSDVGSPDKSVKATRVPESLLQSGEDLVKQGVDTRESPGGDMDSSGRPAGQRDLTEIERGPTTTGELGGLAVVEATVAGQDVDPQHKPRDAGAASARPLGKSRPLSNSSKQLRTQPLDPCDLPSSTAADDAVNADGNQAPRAMEMEVEAVHVSTHIGLTSAPTLCRCSCCPSLER